MMRRVLLSAAGNDRLRDLVTRTPVSSEIVARYVAGERIEDAVRVARELVADGCTISLDHLGEDTTDAGHAARTRAAYEELISRFADAGLGIGADLSIKLSALGQQVPGDGTRIATEHAAAICQAAAAVGATVTLDMEDHPTVDATLETLRTLRADVPSVGVALQAYLYRTEADCKDLADDGSRVRLCKGAYDEPATVAFTSRAQVDRSYVRCLKVLMAGSGYPMIATHDPRLVEIAGALAIRHQRRPGDYEYQMLYGVRPAEQVRLARAGERVRVYVPYGDQWYAYLVRRLAERPANLTFFLRSLATRT